MFIQLKGCNVCSQLLTDDKIISICSENYEKLKKKYGHKKKAPEKSPDKEDYEEYIRLHDSRKLKYKQMSVDWIDDGIKKNSGLSKKHLDGIEESGYDSVLINVPDPKTDKSLKATKLDKDANVIEDFNPKEN